MKTAGVELTRADLSVLDKAGRASKGEVRISTDDSGLILEGLHQQVREVIPSRSGSLRYDRKIWDLCRELLTMLHHRDPLLPGRLALDPSLLARFGKIKTPKGTSPLLDMAINSADDPILIKCGPEFHGALMPVDRSVARGAASRGDQFLW
ncbi:hypothetical protein [Streptomyces chrestomyceticus]